MDSGQEVLEPGGEKRLGDPDFVGFILDFWVLWGVGSSTHDGFCAAREALER